LTDRRNRVYLVRLDTGSAPQEARMAPIRESIEINRRPEDVFAYLDDV
jgi:hypothetical protein